MAVMQTFLDHPLGVGTDKRLGTLLKIASATHVAWMANGDPTTMCLEAEGFASYNMKMDEIER